MHVVCHIVGVAGTHDLRRKRVLRHVDIDIDGFQVFVQPA